MSLALELDLDHLEAELATELPAHVRALAAAFIAGSPAPRAPAALSGRSLTLAIRALDEPSLAARALPLLRLLTPVVLEDDPRVAAARSQEPSWQAHVALMAARDAASTKHFRRDHISWLAWLHGAGRIEPTILDVPDEPAGWRSESPVIAFADVERAWLRIAAQHGVRGRCRIVEAAARPRAFIVEPGREVIVVIGALTTPVMRFAALHELGHALAALVSPVALPRTLDEAAASYVARLLEHEGALGPAWFTPIAAAARDPYRRSISMALHAAEAGIRPPLQRPPWGLWHDPGAQAAYLTAESFADHWYGELGAAPSPGAFAAQLEIQLAHVEAAILADRALQHPIRPQR